MVPAKKQFIVILYLLLVNVLIYNTFTNVIEIDNTFNYSSENESSEKEAKHFEFDKFFFFNNTTHLCNPLENKNKVLILDVNLIYPEVSCSHWQPPKI